MASIKSAGSMDKYEAAIFFEELAKGIRNGNYDVQSLYEGLEIASQNLDGFRIHVAGHVHREIGVKPSVMAQVKRMFHERHHRVQGAWIETIIDEADYRIERFFEDNEDLVEDAYYKFYNAELLYRVAVRLWQDGDLFDSQYVGDISWEATNDHMPTEAFADE